MNDDLVARCVFLLSIASPHKKKISQQNPNLFSQNQPTQPTVVMCMSKSFFSLLFLCISISLAALQGEEDPSSSLRRRRLDDTGYTIEELVVDNWYLQELEDLLNAANLAPGGAWIIVSATFSNRFSFLTTCRRRRRRRRFSQVHLTAKVPLPSLPLPTRPFAKPFDAIPVWRLSFSMMPTAP